MKKLAFAAIAALALSACQTTRTIQVPCIAPDAELPQEPPEVGEELTGQAQRDFQIIAGSAARLRSWGRSLKTVIEGCRG